MKCTAFFQIVNRFDNFRLNKSYIDFVIYFLKKNKIVHIRNLLLKLYYIGKNIRFAHFSMIVEVTCKRGHLINKILCVIKILKNSIKITNFFYIILQLKGNRFFSGK